MNFRLNLTPYKTIYLVYPIVYLGSIPLTLLLKQYNDYISQVFLVKFIESYIVSNHGYFWFTALYWILVITTVYFPNRNKELLTRYTKIYLINTTWIILLLEWFFGSPIFERISVFAGATCSVPGIYREYECRDKGGEWNDPFDSSSHYTFLISSSLLIWYLLFNHVSWVKEYLPRKYIDLESGYQFNNQDDGTNRGSQIYRTTKLVIDFAALFMLLVWFISFVTTSIFFHTIPEKFVGLICGLFIPTLLDYI
ncbi:YFT2 Acyl-coenzyme A diphosphatase YFT2 [Candida maltosa Xu316]